MGIVDGKVAIVTGASEGLGVGIALALAKEGAKVAVCARRFQMVQETARAIEARGGEALALRCDVSKRDEVDAVVAATVKQFGTVDILINNAAATTSREGEAAASATGTTALEDVTAEEVGYQVEVDLLGSLYFMQACFPYLKAHGGSIVNFGSQAAFMGVKGFGAYAAVKEAVRGLTKAAAADWGAYQINVNIVCPAGWTPGHERWLEAQSPVTRRLVDQLIPMGHVGDPELEIGRAVVALSSPLMRFVTGRTLYVDGGGWGYTLASTAAQVLDS